MKSPVATKIKILLYSNDKEIGVVYLSKYKKDKMAKYTLYGLHIKNNWRRRGYATRLIKLCQTVANSIELCCYDRNHLIELYQKCGFRIIGECESVNHVNADKLYIKKHGMTEKQTKMYWLKKRVLVIVDQYGWSYDMLARGLQKYSKYKILIVKLSEVTLEMLRNTDIIFVFSWINLITLQENGTFRREMAKKKIVTGSFSTVEPTEAGYKKYTGRVVAPNMEVVNSIIITDRRLYKRIKGKLKQRLHFSVHPIDTKLFQPSPQKHEGFKVGWCGNISRPDKRGKLLKKLSFNVDVRALWGKKYFKKNRPVKPLVDWYNSLDVYIMVSNNNVEGGTSLTIPEAMACGLPVVSTDHGSEIKHLLDPEWIVPCQPESEVIKQMNEKLSMLWGTPELRKKVGRRNREKIVNEVSWQKWAQKWDEVFDQIGMSGLKYIRLKNTPPKKFQEFLDEIKDVFSSDEKEESLYLWGDWELDKNNRLVLPFSKRMGYLCIDNDKVVGFFYWLFLPEQFGFGTKCVYPSAVVKKEYRGRGIGTKLYLLCEKLARDLGMEKIFVANRFTPEGKELTDLSYIIKHHGFKEIERYPIVSKPKGLSIKPSIVWNKRECLMIRFIKELK